MDRALTAPPPLLMIPQLPPIEGTDEAPAYAYVASEWKNSNVDTMDEEPEGE